MGNKKFSIDYGISAYSEFVQLVIVFIKLSKNCIFNRDPERVVTISYFKSVYFIYYPNHKEKFSSPINSAWS